MTNDEWTEYYNDEFHNFAKDLRNASRAVTQLERGASYFGIALSNNQVAQVKLVVSSIVKV